MLEARQSLHTRVRQAINATNECLRAESATCPGLIENTTARLRNGREKTELHRTGNTLD